MRLCPLIASQKLFVFLLSSCMDDFHILMFILSAEPCLQLAVLLRATTGTMCYEYSSDFTASLKVLGSCRDWLRLLKICCRFDAHRTKRPYLMHVVSSVQFSSAPCVVRCMRASHYYIEYCTLFLTDGL
jgi:hypothetical protein